MERLQKVIASAGITSRRKAEQLILDGKVKVNGKVVKELGVKVTNKDKVVVNGIPLEKEQRVYYVLNKPRSYISAVTDDKDRATVVDILKQRGIKERVFPIGRLDYDTTGVLLLTNDGEFANLMMHPKGEVPKTYIARVKGLISKGSIMKLKKGVTIDGYTTAPAKVKLMSADSEKGSSLVQITIHEGKYHQVKKMFESVGHPVKKLRRDVYGYITCDGLSVGDFRELKPQEVKMLKDLANNKIDLNNIRYY